MLKACEIRSLDAFALEVALLQSALVGHLLVVTDSHYEVDIDAVPENSDGRHVTLRCRIEGVELGIIFAPDFDRGWLGEHQVTPEMLTNPMLAQVYADHLTAGLPGWVSDLRLGESIRSPYTIRVSLTPPEYRDQPRAEAFLSVETVEDLERLRRGLDRHLVLADKQRLDHLQIDLPLVAATVSLTVGEVAVLQATDVIRLT